MKYSRQREEILNVVKDSTDHPTAEMVYQRVLEKIPNISLGTVYRNLKYLVQNNVVQQIKGLDDKDRFDKTLTEHGHMLCQKCQKVFDVDHEWIVKLKHNIEEECGFTVLEYNIVITGICHTCQKN